MTSRATLFVGRLLSCTAPPRSDFARLAHREVPENLRILANFVSKLCPKSTTLACRICPNSRFATESASAHPEIKNRTTRDGNAVLKHISNGIVLRADLPGTRVTAADKQRACLSHEGRNQLSLNQSFARQRKVVDPSAQFAARFRHTSWSKLHTQKSWV
jgi:hypothetical protein